MAQVETGLRQRHPVSESPRLSNFFGVKLANAGVFQPSNFKSSANLVKGVALVVLGVLALAYLPWYFLPLGWFLVGTAQIGLTTIAQDCNDNVFVRSKLVNRLVGAACLLPLAVDMQGFKNSLRKTANHAQSKREKAVRWLACSHLWMLASPVEWLTTLYESHLANWKEAKVSMVANLLIVYAIASFFVLTMWYKVGAWGLMKYYFFPLMVYHFWRSTLLKMDKSLPTLGLPSIPSFTHDTDATPDPAVTHEGNDADSASKGIYCIRYPRWVEFLTNNFNLALSEVRRSKMPTYNVRKAIEAVGGSEMAFKWRDLFRQGENTSFEWSDVDWVTGSFITLTPFIGVYGALTGDFYLATWLVGFVSYNLAGTGITMGYHRLFSHRSWDTIMPIKAIVTLMGSSAFQGSVLTWCKDHRIHHRYTDTNDDPYSSTKGLWWAHMGWLYFLRKHKVSADISDLEKLTLLRVQHDYYPLFCVGTGILLPALICGLGWGDWWGGFFVAGVLSKVAVMQCTFCINSIAHYWGDATFTDQRTPRDSALVSVFTFGEGYHNFHHEFPYDFRNGVHSTAFDPTKWVVATLEMFGLATKVGRVEKELYTKGKIQMQEKTISSQKANMKWGKPVEELPYVTWEELKQRRQDDAGAAFIVVKDIVYDTVDFLEEHPGGRGILMAYLGKDATKAFNGGVYNHSFAARNVLDTMRVARIKPTATVVAE